MKFTVGVRGVGVVVFGDLGCKGEGLGGGGCEVWSFCFFLCLGVGWGGGTVPVVGVVGEEWSCGHSEAGFRGGVVVDVEGGCGGQGG